MSSAPTNTCKKDVFIHVGPYGKLWTANIDQSQFINFTCHKINNKTLYKHSFSVLQQ